MNADHLIDTARYWADRHAKEMAKREDTPNNTNDPAEMLALAHFYATMALNVRLTATLDGLRSLGLPV